jgi:NhaA family Na+:H+ antiporter
MSTTTAHSGRPGHARTPPLRHFAVEYLLALPAGALLALLWSGLAAESYYSFAAAMTFVANDVAMVFFFGWITKEVVEATRPGGALHPWRRTALPVAASFTATVVTLTLFGAFVRLFGEPMLERGWASVLAVDVALGYFVARLIFGRGAMVPFFLVVALSANAFGFLGVAVSEPPRTLHPWPLLGFLGLAVAAAYAGRARGVNTPWYYVLVAGGLSWTGLYLGGSQPALALLPVIPFVPGRRTDPGFFVDAPAQARDGLERMELLCRHPAQLALLLFGLVNAGVPPRTLELGVLALPLAALVGRPAGLLAGVAAGRALGLELPTGIRPRDVFVLGVTTAIGFTMTLFFATAVLGPGQLLAELRAGALLTILWGAVALMTARWLHVGRFGRRPAHT